MTSCVARNRLAKSPALEGLLCSAGARTSAGSPTASPGRMPQVKKEPRAGPVQSGRAPHAAGDTEASALGWLMVGRERRDGQVATYSLRPNFAVNVALPNKPLPTPLFSTNEYSAAVPVLGTPPAFCTSSTPSAYNVKT